MTSLTLAFSTVGDRIEMLVPLLKELENLNQDFTLLVIIQQQNARLQEFRQQLSKVTIVESTTTGLSRSRNEALRRASTDFVWLLDDDVKIDVTKLPELLSLLDESKADILRVQVGCTEDPRCFYKDYSTSSSVSKLTLLRMNSIELILRKEFVLNHDLEFNENIGLGTQYPGNEEVNFLLDAWQHGAKIELINEPYVFHPCNEGGRRKEENLAIMEIRGATASRFGILGVLLLFRWAIRYTKIYRTLSIPQALFKGFVKGYSKFK